MRVGVAAVAVLVGAALGGCAADDPDAVLPLPREATGAVPATTVTASPATTIAPPASTSPLASLIRPAGSMIYAPPTSVAVAAPAAVSVDGIGVRDAAVVAVGVDDAGALAVPGAREVGWYRFAARPGDKGSAVFAAHVAYDGVDGVFRRLADVRVGAEVTVRFDDGTTRSFVVESVGRIDKDELPAELFATVGPSRLVLITCGGVFDRVRRSYEDNVVAIARPV